MNGTVVSSRTYFQVHAACHTANEQPSLSLLLSMHFMQAATHTTVSISPKFSQNNPRLLPSAYLAEQQQRYCMGALRKHCLLHRGWAAAKLADNRVGNANLACMADGLACCKGASAGLVDARARTRQQGDVPHMISEHAWQIRADLRPWHAGCAALGLKHCGDAGCGSSTSKLAEGLGCYGVPQVGFHFVAESVSLSLLVCVFYFIKWHAWLALLRCCNKSCTLTLIMAKYFQQ